MTIGMDTIPGAGALRKPGVYSEIDNSKAVQDVILAHHPALPFTLIGEAAAFVLGME